MPLRVVLVTALALAVASCEQPKAVQGADGPAITLSQYENIKEGMTYEEVSSALGSPGVEQSSSNIGGISTKLYAWNGNTLGASANAMFQNGKMIQKSQFGLK